MAKIVLTGGPSVGKTTVLTALRAEGFATVAESARFVISERLSNGLPPRPSALEFAQEVVRRDIAAYEASASRDGLVFFDRGLVDGLGLLSEAEEVTDEQLRSLLARYPFHSEAFVLPPWPEIYVTDEERDQSFEDCIRIHNSLLRWYSHCGLTLHEVPLGPVAERVAFILGTLGRGGA